MRHRGMLSGLRRINTTPKADDKAVHRSSSDAQAAGAPWRPMAGRRWQAGWGVAVAVWAVAVLVCGPARCPGAAVGAVEGLTGPSVGRAAGPGRLNVHGAVSGASGKKRRGCVCGGVKWPCFGFQGDKRPSCCAKCKLEGMVDIRHRRCNCGRARPYFGMPEDTRPPTVPSASWRAWLTS
ncbi:unnamed protein product [Effrenium voratum]|uniref:Uncharacterized protein n=1 Tax=Effrenium voratum TaxID=2562239 RepID=A0AA36N873_9DINO|nr:unnamed protein product [Effrenium voratum]